MESTTFDRIIKNLCTERSRRQVLTGLLGAAPALGGIGLGAGTTQAAGKRRRRPGPAAADDFVAVCHITSDRLPERIRVRRRALRSHLAHGDFRHVDCCVNDDCDVPQCFTGQCVWGTCSQTQLPADTPCYYGGGGALGYCTADAQCLPKAAAGG
jgi:hypothetical protein